MGTSPRLGIAPELRSPMDTPPHPRSGRRLALALAALLAAVSLLVLATPLAAAGGTQLVSGHISGDQTWGTGTTIIMTGNVTVDAGVVLTIEPGVTVLAYPDVHLYVNGMLEANGTSTSPITFSNYTLNRIWAGLQFNATSKASFLQYASLAYADRAVKAVGSSPMIRNDVIDHAIVGIELEKSSASVWLTRINYTAMGIHANGTGSPVIAITTITTVLGAPTLGIPSVGIFADHLDYIDLASVTVQWVNGSNGANAPGTSGAAGGNGGFAAGLFVNHTTFAILGGNTVGPVLGGHGGNGAPNALGNGGPGGAGGPAAGIVFVDSATSRAQNNVVSGISGGHGGDGGGTSVVGARSGRGGNGGAAVALESVNATTIGWWFFNTLQGIAGGSAGIAGPVGVSATAGNGGSGADALGILASQAFAANASSNTIQNLRGAYGGNGTAGGTGGNATGIQFMTVAGSALVSGNTIRTLTGGPGGSALGRGGSVTAVLALGDKNYNLTTVSANQISALTGGAAGVGGNPGAAGGSAVGIEGLLVTLSLSKNTVQTVTGGQGGATAPGTTAGQGGTAVGLLVGTVPSAGSSLDRVQTITRGASGTGGTPAPPALGLGIYVVGTPAIRVTARLVNDTFASVNDDDLYLDNYSNTTALNSTFSSSKLFVAAAANLTVQYFLGVTVFWPNNVTLVPGATVTVTDSGFPSVPVFSGTLATGRLQWLPVTNRVYVNKVTPVWNATQIDASYPSSSFQSDPRSVNVTASQTQYFTMIDATPPTSTASALPTWTGTLTFTVHYTYSDGNGVGVKNVTLWYSTGGTWQTYATQAASGTGTGGFSFTAAADGTYQFATTAFDNAGNGQTPSPPTANQTWTIVDTTKPGSHVDPLPTYETSLSFTVSWAPDPGTTDINSYQVQYNAGSGWVTWLGDTKATSATFTAAGQGLVQFRSIATDFAGNTEIAPATNDTWTVVDTIPPTSAVAALPAYENRAIFNVSWGPAAGTTDIASYDVQVSVDGGAWTTWTLSLGPGTAAFTASNGHVYAFRSLATDRAGNAESKGTNDTWTIVDTTPPSSSVSGLPRYEASLAFTLTWGPVPGTTDIATYTVYVSEDGGAWAVVSGAVGTAATTASFTGVDGHTYAFRSLATDRAGNVESKSAGNDTFTTVDVTKPYVVTDAPEGAGTNVTPSITVTFSEPMNRLSVQLAFSIAPSINGNFTWSTDGRVVTFTPARALQPGTSYTVVVDTSATDLAGNPLAGLKTFTFTTAADTGLGAGFLGGSWPILLLLAIVAAAGIGFLLYRRRTGQAEAVPEAQPAAPPKAPAAIDDVFLLYAKDGVLIKHETRRLRPDVDTDILSGMLTAVQQFVKDSFRGEEGEELNEMTVGQMHILIGRGKWVVLAAVLSGGDIDSMNEQMGRCIKDMEDHNWDRLEDWDGDMEIAKALGPYVRKLIRGDYTSGPPSA